MTLRNRARSLVIHASRLARLDELAFLLQTRLKGRRYGLIVGVHESPASLATQFREQLAWVSTRFTITSLESFARIWESNSEWDAASKPPILFTFDDGRESNYTVAAPMLESFGGRGVFFVVPMFAQCPPDQALAFYQSNINPNSRPGDETWEDWKPMNPTQIADLASRGHAIGNHTLSHARLAGLPNEELEREIGDSARLIASWTGKPVDAFAWTFGWDAADADAWKVIRRYHRFCFAPCPGAIDTRRDAPSLMWRREIEVKYSAAEYRFLYSGLVDLWWSTRRRHLRKMLGVPEV
jgi:peptidoglycan/xylan/chitin deacetylase (PgdA/CDA1 family)